MRILFLGDPASANTRAWVDGMRALGAEILVASARPDGASGAVALGPRLLPARLRLLLAPRAVARLAASFQPDVLLAYRVTSYGYLAARSGVAPLAVAAQNEQITWMRHPNKPMKLFLERCARLAIARADLLHAWGGNIRDGLLARGADPAKILVMHRGVDLAHFHPPDGGRPPGPDFPVVISTRSLAREYRIDQLLRAFHLLLRSHPAARLDIVGDGPEQPRLMAFAANLGVAPRVRFLGRLPRAETARALRGADCYVSLVQTEGVSSSLIEACASGVFPIVADMPASRELLADGETGLLVRDGRSAAETARAMARAADDARLRADAAARNRAMAEERFDIRRNLPIFLDAYAALADARRKGGSFSLNS